MAQQIQQENENNNRCFDLKLFNMLDERKNELTMREYLRACEIFLEATKQEYEEEDYVFETDFSFFENKISNLIKTTDKDCNIIKNLLKNNNEVGENVKNLLFIVSSLNGYLEILKILIEQKIGMHLYNKALCNACLSGHLEIVKLMVEIGADLDVHIGAPLEFSIKNGHFEIVKFLIIEKGARIRKELINERKHIRPDIYELLKTQFQIQRANNEPRRLRNQTIDEQDWRKYLNPAEQKFVSFLIKEYRIETEKEIIQYLIEKKEDNLTEDAKNILFLSMVKIGYVDVVKYLLDNGANIHINQNTALIYATRPVIDFEMAELLIERGADIKEVPDLLKIAYSRREWKFVRLLLKKQENRDFFFNMPIEFDQLFYRAIDNNSIDFVKLLIEKDVNLDWQLVNYYRENGQLAMREILDTHLHNQFEKKYGKT